MRCEPYGALHRALANVNPPFAGREKHLLKKVLRQFREARGTNYFPKMFHDEIKAPFLKLLCLACICRAKHIRDVVNVNAFVYTFFTHIFQRVQQILIGKCK